MRFSYESRCRVVQAVLDGATPEEAAWAHGASRSSGYRWWVRYRAAGWASLRDRPCTPHRQPRRLSREAEAEIIAVRERSGGGPEVVGAIVDRPASTVGKVLRRLGRSRLPKPPRPPVVRYERARPGELLHIDTKKLGRFWHVGKRILRDGVLPARARAGNTCTSPSTTTPASLTWRCCRATAGPTRSPFSSGRCAGTAPCRGQPASTG